MSVRTFALLALCAYAAPTSAQTYGNTSYPVCMQVFGPFGRIDCSYVSMEQCRSLAVARAAQCIANPYYSGAPRPRSRRSHRIY